jgi:predicted RNA binding protein YcfA (HicA-like mRNA interferase family)
LPIVSGKDAVRSLQKLGFVFARQRGSHVILRCGSIGCVVPLHSELKKGTLASILKQAGITAADFISNL